MEQQGTSTSTVTNIQIPGTPSDASALNSLRNVFRQNDIQKKPTATRTTEVRGTGDVPAHKAISSEKTLSKSSGTNISASADAQSKSPTIERQANIAPAELSATQSKANTQQSLSTTNSIGSHPVPDLITKNHTIRRILERVNWTKLRGEAVEEVATFRELEDAETKFQEFESFIRAEGKNLGLPEGCKPFERVLIQGSMTGSKPCPYIRFTNFRTEEDVRKYHVALSKRKVKHQYHPPLRLCYEIQRLNYHAANAGIHSEGDPGRTLCGKTAVIEDADTRRLITIGGVIKVDNKLYAMTAGHAATAADELKSTSESESPYSPYSDDVEYDDDVESALICGGPSTNSNAGRQPHRGGHNDQHQNTPESAALTFHGSSMSGDDWSLHLIEDPLLALPNALPEMDGVTTRFMTYPASQPFPGLFCLIAGVSGPHIVPMLPGIVSFPLPSGNWASAWKVALNHQPVPACPSHLPLALQRGDSGSWVVDPTNGNVFGHVIASTDTTAFLIPLIHTLDSISRQAKLNGTGEIISLPPAFDMLANLAHVYHSKSGKKNQDHAKLFASWALTSSTKIQSPASEVAPIIDSFLKSYGNYSTISTIVQNLLVWTGADLKGNLATIHGDENSESLSKVIEDSLPIGKEITMAAMRDLSIAFGNFPESFDIREIPLERRLLLPGVEKPEPKEQSSHNEPVSHSRLVHNMPGGSRHSINNVLKTSDRLLDAITKAVSPTLGSPELEPHEKHNSISSEDVTNEAAGDANPSSPPNVDGHLTGRSTAKDRGARFWIIMSVLTLALIHTALDRAVVSTVLPTIVGNFNMGASYVWVVNIYFLATAAVQPFLSHLSDLWGRRWVFIGTVALFVLGSGVIGGAASGTMIIVGRGVQGLGAGGINMMVELIISDLVPPRERGTYMGLILAVSYTVSSAGPVISGVLADVGQWRWIWYMNLPIGGLCLVTSIVWLRLARSRSGRGFVERVLSIDLVGAALIVASTVAILWAIAYGGTTKSWSDGGVIAGLVTGHVGLALFVVWQGMPQCKNPIAPLRLFANRTSAAAFFLTFTTSMVRYWPLFMLPLYFQSVRGDSPKESGIQLLPFIFFFPVGSAFGVWMMGKTGRYKPCQLLGFVFCTVSFGLFSILDRWSHQAVYVVFEMLAALGIGIPMACLLPSVLAPLKESDTAVSMATFAFIGSFGSIWGLAIPAAVFNNRFSQLLHTIDDESARAVLANGKAYQSASATFSAQFTGSTRDQVNAAYTASLQRTWQIAAVFSAVSGGVAFCVKEIPLHRELETDLV